MPPTSQDRLLDIIESISSIEKMIQGKNLEQFASDMMLRLATERLLEIVCEASRRLPEQIKKNEPAINWQRRSISAMCYGTHITQSGSTSSGTSSKVICRR